MNNETCAKTGGYLIGSAKKIRTSPNVPKRMVRAILLATIMLANSPPLFKFTKDRQGANASLQHPCLMHTEGGKRLESRKKRTVVGQSEGTLMNVTEAESRKGLDRAIPTTGCVCLQAELASPEIHSKRQGTKS